MCDGICPAVGYHRSAAAVPLVMVDMINGLVEVLGRAAEVTTLRLDFRSLSRSYGSCGSEESSQGFKSWQV